MYGFFLMIVIMRGELSNSGAFTQVFRRPNGETYTLGNNYLRMGHFSLLFMPKKFAMAFFLFLVTIVALCFTVFQTYLVGINVTTNETFKRTDLVKEKLNEEDAREHHADDKDNKNDGSDNKQVSKSQPNSWFGNHSNKNTIQIPNLYSSKSIYVNLMEGLFPLTLRRIPDKSG